MYATSKSTVILLLHHFVTPKGIQKPCKGFINI